ncbi:MAG: TRAP transporter small permease [Albidovulum sp.]|nr:TRAP transporter small permease [Albidovulum sp.]MDE0530748.1 TRAP transporter small permease [Albidovulum sp.]
MVEAILTRMRSLLRIVGWVELSVTAFLLFAIVFSVGAQVISRYFFNSPLIWVEEGVVYAFIWSVFLGASVGLKAQRHIRIEWLSHISGPRFAAFLYLLRQVVVIVIVVLVFPFAIKVMNTESRSTTVSLPWDMPRFLFFSLPLATSFVLFAVTSLFFLFAGIRVLPSGGTVDPILTFKDDDNDDAAIRAEAA